MLNSCLIFCLVCNGVLLLICFELLVFIFYKWIIYYKLFFYLLKYIEYCWIKGIDLFLKFKVCLIKGIDWMYLCVFMKYNVYVFFIFFKKINCYLWYGVNYIIK